MAGGSTQCAFSPTVRASGLLGIGGSRLLACLVLRSTFNLHTTQPIGGGCLESTKAEQLSEWLEVPVTGDQV